MSWDNHHPDHSGRIPLPVRKLVWKRDNGECQLRYNGVCTLDGEEIDHVLGIADAGRRYDHPDNLQVVCCACHILKTQQQRWPRRAGRLGRQPERHPGIRRERISDAT